MKVPEDRDRLTFCGFKKREPLQFSNVRFGSKSAVGSGRISDGVKNDQNFKCSLEPREHSPKIF